MRINKSPRRIKRDAGGRSKKNPTQQLLAKNSRIQLDNLKLNLQEKLMLDLQGRSSYLTYLLIVITIGIL